MSAMAVYDTATAATTVTTVPRSALTAQPRKGAVRRRKVLRRPTARCAMSKRMHGMHMYFRWPAKSFPPL